ncbi:MAG: hypothetical protein M1827_003275 [Pycnora praestabilis]|nr:MAG: hypothetical protein M1827_003275 [Pycnora praestabilis]
MADQDMAPYKAQKVEETAALIAALEASSKKAGKKSFSCRKATFPIPGPNGLSVDSWRFQDWDYKRRDLPTYARGLFTFRSSHGRPEIVVRGYDKFFNVGEVHKTMWENVEKNTKGPYELSCKENGCIIFISGLEDETLLVCSKHSTGARQDVDLSHAVAGEKWVDRHLKSVGKTSFDLARQLRKMNATAVAELCDDTFEEHVLAYTQDIAGLYLHGINLNLPEFATYPGDLVQKFAEDWGFKKTEYLVEDNIGKVKTFLDGVAETGHWNGRDTEGFVIRCQARDTENHPWVDWFFKYKFEEPYLMYRQWRECTKSVIAGKSPRYKKHKKITEEYLLYARRQLAQNRDLGKAFNQNHGIIAMRDGFLKERGLKGSDIIRQEYEMGEGEQSDVTKNVVLVPVATIGCGKTTVAVALQKLFGWGHVQNDNIEGKKNRSQRFVSEVVSSLVVHPAMIADRNNHQKRERKQMIDDVRQVLPDARLVALYYVHDIQNYEKIRQATRHRVLARGDNHQTIQAGTKSQEEIIGIMEGFLHRFEPIDDESEPDQSFDTIVNLDVTASSRENLETVVSHLHETYPKLFSEEMPTASDLDQAIDAALADYKPDIKHSLDFKNKSTSYDPQRIAQYNSTEPNLTKPKNIEYFCISISTTQFTTAIDALFQKKPPEVSRFYYQLKQTRRIQPSFHVTLIHQASAKMHPETWQRYIDLYTKAPEATRSQAYRHPNSPPTTTSATTAASADPDLGTCRIELERVVWSTRIMCVIARLLDAQESGFETVNDVAHITVGTASSDIKPKESNDLLKDWLNRGSGEESGIWEAGFGGGARVVFRGVVKAVMGRHR